jgi:hypothetical protein
MARYRPLSLLLMGLACTLFAALYLLWMLLYSWPPLRQVVAVAFGDPEPLPELARANLDKTSTVRVALLLGTIRMALVLTLLASGVGLVLHLRWARWAALFSGMLLILVALSSTVLRLSFLTLPGGAVKVTPLLMDAVAILFANVVCGTMFLPEIRAAYAGLHQPRAPANTAASPSAEQPAGV